MNRTIHIESQSRPIRFVYLVRNVAEFTAAVRFYTHSWGGASNLILPLPKTKYQVGLFEYAIYKFEPDLIIYVDDDMPEGVAKSLKDMTSPLIKIGNPEFIEHFSENKGRAFYQQRKLPHMMDILDLHKITGETIICTNNSASVEQGLAVQAGLPSLLYIEQIKKDNNVSYVKPASSYENQIKASILVAASKTARSLTLKGLTANWDMDGDGLDSGDFLHIYLYKNSDIHIWSTYWNQSSHFTKNKLLLPWEGFLENLDIAAFHITEMSKRYKAIRLILNTTPNSAKQLQDLTARAFSRIAGRKIDVDVFYDGDMFHIEPARLAWKKPVHSSQQVVDGSLLQFDPAPPSRFDGSPLAFAFDAELTTKDGIRLGFPNTAISSKILTFGIKRLEQFDYKDTIESWFAYPRIRSTRLGISAVASSQLRDESLADASFFVPLDEDFVQSYVYQSGFSLVPNEAAHYAKAFLRKIEFTGNRAESFDELELAACLIGARYESITCTLQQIIDKFAAAKDGEKPKARDVVNNTLPKLLHAGLVRRGYSIKCKHCMYTDWYPLDEVGETVRCIGCGEHTVTPLQTAFQYRLSELTRRFFQRGGRAVVNTLWLFSQRGIPGIASIGGEIIPIGEKKSVADVDMILLTIDEVGVVECKDWKSIREQGKDDLKLSIQGLITAAAKLGAKSAYLSIATNEPSDKVIRYIKPFYKNARAKGIALRLIVNDRLYEFKVLKGKVTIRDFDLKTSQLYLYANRRGDVVGKRFRGHSGGFDGFYAPTFIDNLRRDLLEDGNV